ncbi:hypothetical protein GALMADRAFT_256476 [Galerina marginata CBS 339.88]|uniref:Uncharacterized protein n=1 Tax=Galerina marginata (strain CBS 339.88) TaxID=685588 RepID=A0A067SPI5_GALM3|nr:hypothetical protein GALMADRAFT_256476 [Galerina marginata CBS 339.88]
MSTRPVVSYDDITLPYSHSEEQTKPSPSSRAGQRPPTKKRKRNNNQKAKYHDDFRSNQTNTAGNASTSHHDDFKNHMNAAYGFTFQEQEQGQLGGFDNEDMEAEGEFEEEEESRELTHQEIWDDSALLDAWEAATEEYEAYHGPEKDWKKESVKRSPLWYNIPVDPSKRATNAASRSNVTTIQTASAPDPAVHEDAERDSKPVDFDTFVPTHDPSLDEISTAPADSGPTMPAFANMNYIPDTPAGAMVSQDEAFQRALNAMYWGGYWTAMYQCQRRLSQNQTSSTGQDSANNEDDAEEQFAGEVDEDEDEEFTPTER